MRQPGSRPPTSPRPLGWQHIPELIRELRRATRRADLVVLGQPYLLPALQAVAPDHAVRVRLPERRVPHEGRPVRRLAGRRRAGGIVEQVERDAVRRAELVVACSEADVEALERLGPTLAEWAVVPNGADVLRIPFTTGDQRRAGRDALVGPVHGRPRAVPGFEHLALFVASYHPPNLRGRRADRAASRRAARTCCS